jgi:hypothetical protein
MAASAAAPANRPARLKSAPPPEPTDPRYLAAKEKVAQLEAEAYAAHPLLPEAGMLQRDLDRKYDQTQRRRVTIYQWLEDQEKASPGVMKTYQDLMQVWARRLHAVLLRDPQKSEMLKAFLTRNDRLMRVEADRLRRAFPELVLVDLRSVERFWPVYHDRVTKHEQMLVERWEAASKATGFPQFVLDQAKSDGQTQLFRAVYQNFITRFTPAVLTQARFERDALLGELFAQAQPAAATTRPVTTK